MRGGGGIFRLATPRDCNPWALPEKFGNASDEPGIVPNIQATGQLDLDVHFRVVGKVASHLAPLVIDFQSNLSGTPVDERSDSGSKLGVTADGDVLPSDPLPLQRQLYETIQELWGHLVMPSVIPSTSDLRAAGRRKTHV